MVKTPVRAHSTGAGALMLGVGGMMVLMSVPGFVFCVRTSAIGRVYQLRECNAYTCMCGSTDL